MFYFNNDQLLFIEILTMRTVTLGVVAFLSVLANTASYAGISYSVLPTAPDNDDHAVVIQAVLFNDEANELNWAPPKALTIQWQGESTASTATLVGSAQSVSVPVNSFVLFQWSLDVPEGLHGKQSFRIEEAAGQLLSFDVNQRSTLALSSDALEEGSVGTAVQQPVVAASTETSPFQNFRNAVSAHEPIYFIFGHTPQTHARFQLSFKYRLFSPKQQDDVRAWQRLYFAYTQTSIWDLHSDSSPFVDTTYNPSLFWRNEKLLSTTSGNVYAGLTAGVEHASNGKDGDSSRSVNDYFIQPEFNYRFPHGSVLSFAPRFKSYFGLSDNPDYAKYVGHVDWKLSWHQENGLAVSGMYTQGDHGRRAQEVNVAWPLRRTFLKMNGYLFAQYRNGYAETLLSYRQRTGPHFRLGFALTPF